MTALLIVRHGLAVSLRCRGPARHLADAPPPGGDPAQAAAAWGAFPARIS